MAIQHHITLRDRVEGHFHCRRCGARAHASFMAAGGGSAREGVLNSRDEASRRAADEAEGDLAVDAERVLRYLRCPKCGKRNPGALQFVAVLIGMLAAAGLAAALLASGDAQLVIPIGAGIIILFAIAATHGRIKRGNDAVLTVADPTRPPAPIAPPPSAAPRAPDDGPSMLGRVE